MRRDPSWLAQKESDLLAARRKKLGRVLQKRASHERYKGKLLTSEASRKLDTVIEANRSLQKQIDDLTETVHDALNHYEWLLELLTHKGEDSGR